MTTSEVELVSTGWIPDSNTFGARLALVRQHMSWGNVKEAAVECGLPPESWRTWERDGVAPRRIVETAQLIAKRTGCDFMWLLVGSKPVVDTLRYASSEAKQQVNAGTGSSIGRGRPLKYPTSQSHPGSQSARPPSYPRDSRRPSLMRHR